MWNLQALVQFQVGEMTPAVFQYFKDEYKIIMYGFEYKIIMYEVMDFVAENGIVVMTAGSQTGNPKSIIQGSQFLCLLLWSLYSDRPIGA